MIKRFVGIVVLLSLSGCSMLQKKVDPRLEYTTETGFQFRFAMSGEWLPGPTNKDLFIVGQKPRSDGATKLAMVRHGPIATDGGNLKSNKHVLEAFKKDMENDTKGGRVSKVKSQFTQKKYI